MKMKMIIFVLIVVLLIPGASFAEGCHDIVPVEIAFQASVDIMPYGEAPSYEKYAYSACYLPVTYKTMQGNVVTNEVTYYEKVAEIRYKYYIKIDSEDKCVGGHIVATQGWPEVTKVDAPHLGLQIDTTDSPTGYVMPLNDGDNYQVVFSGGCLEITYNAVIYKDIFNQQIGQDSVPVTRSFYYTETGVAEP